MNGKVNWEKCKDSAGKFMMVPVLSLMNKWKTAVIFPCVGDKKGN